MVRREDGVFAMAIHAQGGVGIPGQGLAAMHAVLVIAQDELVAAAARLRLSGHQMGLADPLDIVDTMAVRTDGGKLEEGLFEESFPFSWPGPACREERMRGKPTRMNPRGQ